MFTNKRIILGVVRRQIIVLAAAMLLACVPAVSNAQTFTWDNPAGGNWNVATNWTGGIVPQSSGQAVDIPLAVPVYVNISPDIGSLSIDNSGTTLDILNGDTLTVTNGITNNGTIVVNSNQGTSGSNLTFSGSQTLSGAGSVILNGSGAYLNTSNNGVLTQAATHTINGQGTIYAALTNQGLVNANVNGGTLYLDGAITNAATMEATGGGVLGVNTTVNNANGTILASGGNVQINGGTVVGGTLTSTGSSYFSSNDSGNLNGVTLSTGSQFNIAGNTTVTNGITNNGTIAVSGDELTFSGTQTLSGTGSVILNAGTVYMGSSSGTLTQALGHTISGQGTITATLINQGVINANVNGQTLSLGGVAITNAATMEATGGGVLNVRTTVNNAGETILASGGGNVQINGGTVVGGTLTSTDTSYFSAGSGGGNLNGVIVSNGSQFNILNGDTLTVTNGITNNGTIVVNSNQGTSGSNLTFSGSQTLSGAGSVILNGSGAYLNTSNNGVLTQAATHTINGQGTIYAALTNQGLVNANVNGGTLYLDGAITNAATMEATGGGVLGVNTTVNNANGTILASGGNVQINGGTVVGGTLTSTGSSYFSSNDSGNLNGVTLSTGSQFNIAGNTTVTNGITNNGTIAVSGDELTFSGTQTLSGTGSVILNAGTVYMGSSSGTLTQALGHTISGQGTITATLINQGVINANVNGQTLSLGGVAITNAATMEATGGGVLNVRTTVNNAGETILASGGGNVQINGGTVVGGTLTSTDTSYFSAGSGGGNLNGVIVSNGSQFNILNGDTLTVTNGITNNGTIVVNSNQGTSGSNLTFSGSQTLSGAGSVILNGSGAYLNTSNNGVLTQAATHTINGQGTIYAALTNQGLVNANVNGGTLYLDGAITNAATMEAIGGGVLGVNTTVNNANGTILASGGNVQINGGTVVGGTLTSTGSSYFSSNDSGNLNGVTLSTGSQFNIAGNTTVTNGITNNGTIAVSGDELTFSGTQTLSGTGSVILNAGTVYMGSSSGTLTQALGHTISGQGTITATLINQGVINANVNGQTLSLGGVAITNAATMEATGGGVLNVRTTVNNAGETILASGGGNVQINGGTVVGGTLTSTDTSYFSAGSGGGNLNGVIVSNGSQFNILNGDTLTVTNGITNNGTIVVNSNQGTSGSNLTFSGSQTLSGAGSVILNGSGAYLNTSNNGVLTQAATHTINGQGTIYAALTNQGLVNANVNGGTLYLDGAITNAATMEATGGGVLGVNTTVNNANGTILASGGNVQINGGTVVGGTLTSTGSSYFSSNDSGNLNGVTLSTGSQFNIAGNTTVTNGITNNGTIAVSGDELTFSGTQTLSGTGSVILNAGTVYMGSSSGTLTQALGHTISGQGTITATLINQGVINANVNGQTLSLGGVAITNAATMEATGGGVLNVRTTVNNAGETILASGGGNVQINGGTVVGGTLTSTDTSYFSAGSGGGNLNGVIVSNGSQFNILNGDTLTVTNGITNNGTIVVNSNQGTSGSNLTFSGSQTLSGAGSVILNGSGAYLNTSNNGVLTQAAAHTISGQGTIYAALNNLGTVEAQGGTLTVAGPVTQFSGSTLTGGSWIACANSTLNASSAGNFLTNQGNVILNGPNSIFTKINSLTSNQGSFTVEGGRSFTTAGALSNSGTVEVGSGSTLTVAGLYSSAPVRPRFSTAS